MPEEIDHIAELQKRLYTRDPDKVPKQKYGILRPIKQNTTSAWGETNIPKDKTTRLPKTGGYRRFFIVCILFFLAALAVALFSIFRGAVTLSSRNVDLAILGNSFVAGGEELPLQIDVANRNSSDLLDATVVVQYPKGAKDETGSEMTRITETLGTIASGKTKSVGLSAILYGEQGISRTITATLSYRLGGSTATFEKIQTFSVLISSSPIVLTVDGPSVVAANQPFTLTLRSLFTGDQPLSNGVIRIEYPSGFTFLSATPSPRIGNTVWTLAAFEKGKEQTITIKGKLSGIEGDEKAFRVYLGTPVSETDSRIAVSYNSALHALTIEQPFLAADIMIGNQTDDIVALPIGSPVTGVVSWRNTTSRTLTNPLITLALSDEHIDLSTVAAPNGYFNELERTITWTSASEAALTTIDPGESGLLQFTFSPASATTREDITLALSVEATIPENDNEVKTISRIDETTIRFAARIQFAAQALYSTGPIKNTGPFPPKANQETSYTITWTARPSDNPLSNVVAVATLPQNATWAGVIMPQQEALTYNPATREVRWNVGTLPRATATLLSKSVSFQVKARPTLAQVGDEIELLSETKVTATDASANVALETIRTTLSTRLSTDPAYEQGDEKVIP